MKNSIGLLMALAVFNACGDKNTKDNEVGGKLQTASTTVNQVVGIGKIQPEEDIIQLSSQVNGIVIKILKKESDPVSLGTPILELDHQLEDAKVRQLTSEVVTQADQIKVDEAGVGEYEAKYNNAEVEVKRLETLLAKGAETQQTVDNAVTNMRSYQSNLERLRASVTVSKSRLEQTRAALLVAEAEREQRIIKSPVNGVVLEMNSIIGGAIDTKQSIAQIAPEGKTIAICEIDELYADKIVLGQKAWIRNVGSLDTLSTGTVYMAFSFLKKKSLFTDQAGEKEDRRVRTIKISLNQPEKLLLNARVECVVDISAGLKK